MPTYRQPGTVLTSHTFGVPLDHARPDGPRIEVFAREVVAAERADDELPWLLFLQGGPGFGGPRPFGRETWLDRALQDYRVLLLDQRGTGLSTPVNRRTLARVGSAREQAEYLAHFRADSIVHDAEVVRRALLGEAPWSVLGQSFGGFCTVTYLSFAPQGVREAFVTGGLPSLDATADDVYRLTYPLVATRNAAYYERYPDDVETVRRVARHLRDHEVRLPGGGKLTVEAFQALGLPLGMRDGADQLHYLLEYAFADGGGELSDTFLTQVGHRRGFVEAPLNLLVHEPCYAHGRMSTRWSAHRVRAQFPDFDARAALDGDAPVLFTGEMVYPWMLDDPVLQPLATAAHLLAEREGWPELYDGDRLRINEVPVAAAVYHEDMYVPYELSMPTARAIRGLRPWVTNAHQHDGLRVSGGEVLDRLIRTVRGLV